MYWLKIERAESPITLYQPAGQTRLEAAETMRTHREKSSRLVWWPSIHCWVGTGDDATVLLSVEYRNMQGVN